MSVYERVHDTGVPVASHLQVNETFKKKLETTSLAVFVAEIDDTQRY